MVILRIYQSMLERTVDDHGRRGKSNDTSPMFRHLEMESAWFPLLAGGNKMWRRMEGARTLLTANDRGGNGTGSLKVDDSPFTGLRIGRKGGERTVSH
jgi:hypothetical protein